MTATFLHGDALGRRLLSKVASRLPALSARIGRPPCLAVVTGTAASASAYKRRILDYTLALGFTIRDADVPADASAEDMVGLIHRLNADDAVDGILILFPLPYEVTHEVVTEALDPAKDVDGLTPANAGRLARGLAGLFPCTPQAALILAEDLLGDLRGIRATVVGASPSVGRPLVEMLLQRGATVTVAHADTRDLPAACIHAELLLVAVGKPGLIDARHVAPGATVIDIGINCVPDGRGGAAIVGDVDLASVLPVVRAISAVPDGVGPLTTAILMRNTLTAAERRCSAATPDR